MHKRCAVHTIPEKTFREEAKMQDHQIRDRIHPKQHVLVAVKENGVYREDLKAGVVEEILTNTATHYRGITVRLADGTVGRVQQIHKGRKEKQ